MPTEICIVPLTSFDFVRRSTCLAKIALAAPQKEHFASSIEYSFRIPLTMYRDDSGSREEVVHGDQLILLLLCSLRAEKTDSAACFR